MAALVSKRNAGILLYWILGWLILSNIFLLYRFVGLNWAEEVFILSPKEWLVLYAQVSFIGLSGGVMVGFMDLYLNHKNYLHRISFGSIIMIKSLGYFIISIIVLFLGFYIAALLNGYNHHEALTRSTYFFTSSYFLVIMIYLLVNMMLLNFIRQVSEKFGPGNLVRLFFGRYYKPVEERRIFMFLDLRSSTQYAEMLGHIRYSQLIQDCFIDITPAIEDYEAQIYQYAGDEVILTWRCEKDSGYQYAVMLFFSFREKIQQRAEYYRTKYGFIPEFKAGIHAGIIVVTEVGVKKKEIAYHGDAINTTSRIQEQCNPYNQVILCSEYFATELEKFSSFETFFVDEFLPKGKRLPVKVYGVKPANRIITIERS